MRSPFLVALWAVLVALPAGCSQPPGDRADAGTGGGGGGAGTGGGGGAGTGDGRRVVPEGLSNTNLNGDDVGLVLTAFTLIQGASAPELYAAVRNDDVVPACNGGLMTYFVDKNDEVVTSVGSGLQGGRLYRVDSGSVVTCLAPGEIAMTAFAPLPAEIVIDQLGYLKHQLPYFIVNGLTPVGALAVSGLQAVTTTAGTTFTGTVTNGIDVTVTAPTVSVYPLNRVGRPLGVARSKDTGSSEIAPGGTWTFETTAVDDPGVDRFAHAAATIPGP